MSLTAGSRCGPYQIIAPLGAGGMGEVYRARDPRLGRDVAIKMLPAALAAEPDRLGRFRREAQTLAALNHPNIASIYGLEHAEDVPCLVLELVEGETLATRLERGALPIRDALAICVQIAAAIEAAHERGIVHRDLKPGNVMLTTSGMVKVLDFGLAKNDPVVDSAIHLNDTPTVTAWGAATVPGVVLGTAAYMSPEQARGRAVDRRTDVWSFGCVLYECLTGRPAFTGDTASDLIARILEREVDWTTLPAATPARVREIVKRCLRKDAGERVRDIRDVRLELTEAAAGISGSGTAPAKNEQSIAVLPFENLSGADDEYFADGITDEILNTLARVDGLRVAARTSCFAFKGQRADLRTVAEKLDVATVLEGSVRRAGNRLRITVQLVNTADGYQLWSERYDRDMTDVFAVQDEIATAIATRLRGAITKDEGSEKAKGTKNLEAYEAFLKGRALQGQRGGAVLLAIGWFEKAIALDPGYAEPLAWLADSWRLLATYGTAPPSEAMPKAKAAAERALALDPNLADALCCLGNIASQWELDTPKAQSLVHRAMEIDPRSVRARCERALLVVGPRGTPLQEALSEMARCAADDPLSSWVAGIRSLVMGFAQLHEESLAESRRSVELAPDSYFARYSLMRAETTCGHYQAAIAMAPALLAMSGRHPWALGTLGWSLAKAGDLERATAVFEELEARSRHEFIAPMWLAAAAMAVGRTEVAHQFVVRAVKERDGILPLARLQGQFDDLRTFPELREYYARLYGETD